jgi:hypothetical protein
MEGGNDGKRYAMGVVKRCGDGLDEQTAAAENAALLRLRLPNDAAMQYGPMLRLKLRWLHIIWPRRGRHARARTN